MSDPVWGNPKWLAKQGGEALRSETSETQPKRRPKMEPKPKPTTRPARRIIQTGQRFYPQWDKGSHWELFYWPGTLAPVWFETPHEAERYLEGEKVVWSE